MPRDIALHLYNLSGKGGEADYKRKLRCPTGMPTGHIGVKEQHSADQIISSFDKIAGGDKVRIMRILAHGNTGILFFPQMMTKDTISQKFTKLRSYFSTHARLEIHSCGLASDTSVVREGADPRAPKSSDFIPGAFNHNGTGRGVRYLARMSSITNLPVTAGINVQFSDDNDWMFEGDTVTCYPNNTFSYQKEKGRAPPSPSTPEELASLRANEIVVDYVMMRNFDRARLAFSELVKKWPTTKVAKQAKGYLPKGVLEKMVKNGESFF